MRTRVEKNRSGQLASQVPFWHYLGISPVTDQLDTQLQAHVFRHCSASRIHADSLQTRTKTFLLGVDKAC